MLKPFASHPEQLAADDAQQGWMKRLHRAPLKPSCSWCSLLRLWNTKLEEWCSFDFAEATQDQLVEQAPGHVSRCAAAAVHIPSMINHTNKPINQHEPFRAPGAPEPRGLGAGASVARLVIQHLEHIELTNVHRRGYLWACWVIICRSCRGSRLRAADVVMKTTCRRRRTPDPGGVFL